jgi:hypothetical protein
MIEAYRTIMKGAMVSNTSVDREKLDVPLTLVVTKSMIDQIRAIAADRQVPHSYIVRWALATWLDANMPETADKEATV